MRIHKFASVDAFVAIDLAGAETSSGPVRQARRILQGGAKDLARSQTYTYAVLNMRHGGASAGISAEGPSRADAVSAFVAEAAELVDYGTYLPDAAKGVGEADLAPLRAKDPRDTARLAGDGPTFADRCDGLSAAVCAQHSVGDLSGRPVAIEGFNANGPALAAAVVERGAAVTAVATPVGTVRASASASSRTTFPGGAGSSGAGSGGSVGGFDATVLADAWAEHGPQLVNELGDVGEPGDIFTCGADVFFVGSKMGVVNHSVAAQLQSASAVVACGRLPVTARALAVLRRAGVSVPADFVALAGASLALWGDPACSDPEMLATVAETVGAASSEFATHEDGPFLAACFAAEAYLSTWQDELPFGRPLAP